TFLIGLGTRDAVIATSVFILVHALYKASLFLVTGIIDHEAHTRDITRLSGLRKVLLPVAVAGFLAALSSAGVPLSFGFIGKDLIYEATLHAKSSLVLLLTILAVLTNICLVAAGFMAGIKPFAGKLPDSFKKIHLPYTSMWLPPLILSILGVLFGLMPAYVGELFSLRAADVMLGTETKLHLKLWHGFNTVLLLSLVT